METGPNVKFARRVSQQDSLLSVVLSATYGHMGIYGSRSCTEGSNPSLSAMFSITCETRDPRCNPLVRTAERQPYDLGMRLGHFIRHHVTVQVHRGANVGVPHEFLLYSDWRSDGVQP